MFDLYLRWLLMLAGAAILGTWLSGGSPLPLLCAMGTAWILYHVYAGFSRGR